MCNPTARFVIELVRRVHGFPPGNPIQKKTLLADYLMYFIIRKRLTNGLHVVAKECLLGIMKFRKFWVISAKEVKSLVRTNQR